MSNSFFTPEFLEELRAKNDLVSVASNYITLNRRGSNYWACCPFHNEKEPSMSIKPDGQFFKCFGCGESGNVINFVMKIENASFVDAVEILCKNCGMELPTTQDNEDLQKRKRERDRIYNILKATTEFYKNNLKNNPESVQAKYLKSRGLNNQTIEKFQIGISLDYETLPKHLLSLGFKENDMILAGVVARREDGQLYDFYGTRVVFPICNGYGDVVAYSGRAVDPNARAKYKNTPQTSVFNKSEILFAYNFVRDLKKERMLDTIIIVEGHIDVIACHQAGVTNTIGCMGTALTTLHSKKIKQLVDNVVLCLDADNAGSIATYKAIDTLKEVGLNVRVVRLQQAKDPDEFITKFGKENFLNEIMSAQDCVDFVLKDSAKKYDLNSNLDKTKYIGEALNYISKFSTPAEQEIYLSLVQKMVKVPIDALRKSLNRNDKEIAQIEKQENVKVEAVGDNFIRESKIMLLSSMLYKKLNNFEEIAGLFTQDDELSKLYEFLSKSIKENKNYNVSTLFDNFDINANSLIDKVINYVFPADEVFNVYLKETIKRVKVYELEQEREKVQSLMKKSATIEEQLGYLNTIKELDAMIKKEKMS